MDPRGGEEEGRNVVLRMCGAMGHRGRAGKPGWVEGRAALAALGGHPGTTADEELMAKGDRVVVMDGVLFNQDGSRRQLIGPPEAATSGAGMWHAAWAQWGVEALGRLEGMFAVAVWDRVTAELLLVRDRMGEKPLYYADLGDRLLFASEVRALLATGLVPPLLNEEAVADYLRHGAVHVPDTMVKAIRMLPPGHALRWSGGTAATYPWWNLAGSVEPAASSMDGEEVRREVRRLFLDAVEKRMAPERKVGAFLSGGIDSSAVVGAMARISPDPVRTFTLTFDEAEYSEARYARIVAGKYGTEHKETCLRPDAMLGFLPKALAAMDHPSMDGPNTWVAAMIAREAGLDIAVSGLGGDELFAGYEVFKRSLALWKRNYLTAIPRPLRTMAGTLLGRLVRGAAGWKTAALLGLPSWKVAHTYPVARLLVPDRELRNMLAGQVPPDVVRRDVQALLGAPEAGNLPPLGQVSLAELAINVPDMLLRDTVQMAMAHGLEIRSPFMDRHLIGFVLGVRDDIKYPHTPKQLLTDSLGDILPQEVVHRPKMGFTLPWDTWMRKELRTFCEDRMMALAKRPQFKRKVVETMWVAYLKGDPKAPFTRIWAMVALEEWLAVNRVG